MSTEIGLCGKVDRKREREREREKEDGAIERQQVTSPAPWRFLRVGVPAGLLRIV